MLSVGLDVVESEREREFKLVLYLKLCDFLYKYGAMFRLESPKARLYTSQSTEFCLAYQKFMKNLKLETSIVLGRK